MEVPVCIKGVYKRKHKRQNYSLVRLKFGDSAKQMGGGIKSSLANFISSYVHTF